MELDTDTALSLFEALLYQGEAIRELKLQVEALKNMFFEHRPPFREAFAEHHAKVAGDQALRRADEQLAKLRAAVEELRRNQE